LLLIVVSQIAPRAAASWSSWSGCCGVLGWTDTSDVRGGARGEEGHSSIRAIPAGAWEESTWSTRSAASMNDVDAEEHRQTMAAEERPWQVLLCWCPFLLIVCVRPALQRLVVHDGQGPAPAGQLAGDRGVSDGLCKRSFLFEGVSLWT